MGYSFVILIICCTRQESEGEIFKFCSFLSVEYLKTNEIEMMLWI